MSIQPALCDVVLSYLVDHVDVNHVVMGLYYHRTGWWLDIKFYAAVLAQLVERVAFNHVVVGSIPTDGDGC